MLINTRSKLLLVGLGLLALISMIAARTYNQHTPSWTDEEVEVLRTLWIGSLPDLPSAPSNKYADNADAAALGKLFFFDPRFSGNEGVSCATCHRPGFLYTDVRGQSPGMGLTGRAAPTAIGAAYSPWLFWDGRADSLWSQALGPLESSVEHGGSRGQYVHLIAQYYRDQYESIFGPLPDFSDQARFPAKAGPVLHPEANANWEAMIPEDRHSINQVFANMGKAIAAYERLIQFGPSRFDEYVEAVIDDRSQTGNTILSADEVAGLRLFIGKADCLRCHSGPLLTDNKFHNIATPNGDWFPDDRGRASGVAQVLASEFNCLGEYSDAGPNECRELQALNTDGVALEGAFKTPTLRIAGETAPYMHSGLFTSLEEVMQHYNDPPRAVIGLSELQPLNLSEIELVQLQAFINSLTAPLSTPPEWLAAPELPQANTGDQLMIVQDKPEVAENTAKHDSDQMIMPNSEANQMKPVETQPILKAEAVRLPSNGAIIRLVSPQNGIEISEGTAITVEIEHKNFVLGLAGRHWHIHVDGQLWQMVYSQTAVDIIDLEPGQHEISVYLALEDHQELADGAFTTITVK